MVDYLQKGQTINVPYYASHIRQLRENIKSSALENSVQVYCSLGQCSSSLACHCYVIAMAAIKRSFLVPIFSQIMTSYMQWRTFWTVRKRTSFKSGFEAL